LNEAGVDGSRDELGNRVVGHPQPPGDQRNRRSVAAAGRTLDHEQQHVALRCQLASTHDPRRIRVEPAQRGSKGGRISDLVDERLL